MKSGRSRKANEGDRSKTQRRNGRLSTGGARCN